MALDTNQLAPNFELPSTSGDNFILSDSLGKPCILYFYPKDFTPGCTKEACEFRDAFGFFRDLDIDVYGISQDSLKSHFNFKEKHQLPFELLADIKGAVSKLYQASLPFLKINRRITYLLSQEHRIVGVYESFLGAEDHVHQMIDKVKKEIKPSD